MEGLPEAAREEMAQYRALAETRMKDRTKTVNARQAVARHVLVTSIAPIWERGLVATLTCRNDQMPRRKCWLRGQDLNL